jgi:hypothetical protein
MVVAHHQATRKSRSSLSSVRSVNPFEMTDAKMVKVQDELRAQRPLLRSYTTDMTSVDQSLAADERTHLGYPD